MGRREDVYRLRRNDEAMALLALVVSVLARQASAPRASRPRGEKRWPSPA